MEFCGEVEALARIYQTIQDVDDGFGGFILVFLEYTHPRSDPESRAVVGVLFARLFGHHGIEVEIPNPNKQERTSWVLICRGRKRVVDDLHTQNSGYSDTSSELPSEQAIAKEGEPVSTAMTQSFIKETRTEAVKTLDPTYFTKEDNPMK